MFHKLFSLAGTLLIGGAAILMMPAFSQAHGGGGGHGGGGHGGGGHFGGGHFGGGHSGGSHFGTSHFGTSHFGTSHFGTSHFGTSHFGGTHFGAGHFGGSHFGSHFGGRGFGHHRYGGYGYYPYYGYGGYGTYYYPNYYSGYYSPYGDVAPDYGYGGLVPDYGDSTPAPPTDYQALYSSSSAAVQPDTTAHVTVRVPADAKVTLNGTPNSSTGMVRQFVSPPLAPGSYIYDVEARWNESGQEVTQTQHVAVTPGAHVQVVFPMRSQTEQK